MGQVDKSDSSGSNVTDQQAQINIYKLNVGSGFSSKNLLVFLSSLMYNDENSCYILRYSYSTEFNFFGPIPDETTWDIGLLYGWSSRYFAFGIGLSYVNLTQRGVLLHNLFFGGEYQKITLERVGVPIQIELSGPLFPFLGGAIIAFANLNTVNSYVGLVAAIEIGKLK